MYVTPEAVNLYLDIQHNNMDRMNVTAGHTGLETRGGRGGSPAGNRPSLC